MRDRHLSVSLDEDELRERPARSVSPARSRGAKKPANRSNRSSAKRSKRSKSIPGGIHQRRNKRSSW